MTPDILRDFLNRRRLKPEAFAAECGISRATVYNWLAGKHPIKPWVGMVTAWMDSQPMPKDKAA
jgi:transcriptional regulator with XRE-family HTH domain